MDYLIVLASLAAFFAGFVDAIVGGGGLVQVPAMFVLFPQMPVSVVIGTNRTASFVGTLVAGYQYARKIAIPWRVVASAGIGAAIFAYAGAFFASLIAPNLLKPVMLFVMLLLVIYTIFNKELGRSTTSPTENIALLFKSFVLGACLGFYNGFIGPGTGTLLVFGFSAWLKFSFLSGSGISKFVNAIADIASLVFFLMKGLVLFHIALPMLVCNVAGSYLGSRLAMLKGNAFIRIVFLCVVASLMMKFGYDWFIDVSGKF